MKKFVSFVVVSAAVAGCTPPGTDITKNSNAAFTGELAVCSDPVVAGCPTIPTLGDAVESKSNMGSAMARALMRMF
ncbi:MAG: hypothetical protein AAFV27_01570 [Pseudomonadota bacterium]